MPIHPFPPVWDSHSRVLVLGSFPSVRSRETGFYYGHPQNRFWPLLSRLFEEPLPLTIPQRRELALRHGIALWDVIESCEITGSSDASIRNAAANDVAGLLRKTNISRIVCNGRRAHELYQRHCQKATGMEALCLPSTSAANAAWNLDRLWEAWQALL